MDLSIVIGFRDWGLDRLAANVSFHLQNAKELSVEVVVVDYGSQEPDLIRRTVEEAGGRVVRINVKGHWNRSAALNAGVEAAVADIVITTDADIIFTPKCYEIAVDLLRSSPDQLVLVQCRDLPPGRDVHFFKKILGNGEALDFDRLLLESTLRPRWGMGGFAAFTRGTFFAIHGYEERMMLWGKEDNDFAKRYRLSGKPLRWVQNPEAAIFHVWHESSQVKAKATEESRAIVATNQKILDTDGTRVRNTRRRFKNAVPTVSVIIPTFQRETLLRQALFSCRSQTFENFEVLVIENGGGQSAKEIVTSLDDDRFRYISTPKKGAAAARNIGLDAANGQYIAITDDDDLMLSTRLETQLAAFSGNAVHGTYGGWIDFNHDTHEPVESNPGKTHSFGAMITLPRVIMHPTLMLDARVFRKFRYNESLEAGIDYGLLLTMSFHGLQLSHCGQYVLLRRLHGSNMTALSSDTQKASAKAAHEALRPAIPPELRKKIQEEAKANTMSVACDNESAALDELRRYERLWVSDEPSLSDEDFDGEWYSRTYPDVALMGLDPWSHYKRFGRRLGRSRRPE